MSPFQTDTTRIVTLKLNNDHSSLRFPNLVVDHMIHHLLSHADTDDRLKVNRFFVEQLAHPARRLDAIDEGHPEFALRPACKVSAHATLIGSGTVARTKRIAIERRAEAAVIAWIRHQTTGYESMKIARVKGQRREIRRLLAQLSKEILGASRRGDLISAACQQ